MKKQDLSFMDIVVKWEVAGMSRERIMLEVKDRIKIIDDDKKSWKKAVEKKLLSMGYNDALKMCNTLSETISGADDKTRKALERRRSFFKTCLSNMFKMHDFTVEVTTRSKEKTAKIVGEFVGDADKREALSLLASVRRFVEIYELNDDNQMEGVADITPDDLAGMIKATKNDATIIDNDNESASVDNYLLDVTKRAAEQNDLTTDGETEQAEQAEQAIS